MKPIYFPFTYISKPVAEALYACFGKAIVYHPSSKNIPEETHRLVERGLLDIRTLGKPEKKAEEKLSAILKEYYEWANLHRENRGIQLDFFKAGRNKIPFFDDTSASQIKADIKDGTGDKSVSKEPDPVFNARIFLSIAQNFDMQNNKIVQDMTSFETARANLIKSLKGEDETSSAWPVYEDPFKTGYLANDEHMIPERIVAWASLICCEPIQGRDELSGLFITSSRQVIDYLLEKTHEAENVFSIDAIPLVAHQVQKPTKWPKDLMEYLETVMKSSRPVQHDPFTIVFDDLTCAPNISLSLYLVPETSPLEYFSRFIRFDPTGGKIKKDRAKLKNTVIGHIDFSA